MGTFVPPSALVAELLRTRRAELGLTLRDVEERARSLGDPIPITVIARAERGEIDPGFRRLHLLLRIYELPIHVAGDLADLEQFAGGVLPTDAPGDFDEAVQAWKEGDLKQSMMSLLALRTPTSTTGQGRLERQRKLLSFAVAAAGMGKFRLSHYIVEELLLESPEPELVPRIMTQAATCWLRLGSSDVALAFLARAEVHVKPADHQNLAWIKHSRATTLVSAGRPDEAQAPLDEAIRHYRAAKDTHGEARVRGVLVNLLRERGDLEASLAAAREAQAHAAKHGHERIRVMRRIDEGQLLLAQGDSEAGIAVLHDAAGGASSLQDPVCQFHAHYHLWVAFSGQGDTQRADLELATAQYFVRFLDEATPEAIRVRETLGQGRETPATRKPESARSRATRRRRKRKVRGSRAAGSGS